MSYNSQISNYFQHFIKKSVLGILKESLSMSLSAGSGHFRLVFRMVDRSKQLK